MAAAVPDDNDQLPETQAQSAKSAEYEYLDLLGQLVNMGSIPNGNAAGPAPNGLASLTANRGQMDINMLYQKLLELSDVLKDNREKTQGIVASAEEYAARSINGSSDREQNDETLEVARVRIAELTRENLDLLDTKEVLLREQKENTKLIGEYETAVGSILEQVRNLSFDKEAEKVKVQREYNQLLQEEKDAHLRTRLERDEWHSRFLQSLEMLRKAYRLRCEEEDEPTRIIAGLQNEVRGYRQAMGMEAERPEDEYGHRYLKTD